jgi:NitT/TauT family transport system ATP-binding protein
VSKISICGVSKKFQRDGREIRAVASLDAFIPTGEFVTVVGPSGCGKSTLLRMIAGLLPPTKGEIFVEDELVVGPVKNCGIVFQRPILLQWRNTLNNILLQIEMRGLNPAHYLQKARELLEKTGLSDFEDSYPHELSGGMQQRVAIARALVHESPLLLMDEPFGALDALTREQMRIDLEELWMGKPTTVVFVTHSIDEAVLLADRVIVMTPRPAEIDRIVEIDMPRPRGFGGRESANFDTAVKEITEMFLSRGIFRKSASNTKQ